MSTPGVQGCRVYQGASGEDPGHLAAHQALGVGRVLHLVADHHLETRVQQLGEVGLGRMDGKAGHGDALRLGAAPGSEGDVQGRGGLFGVPEEGLIEVAHLEKEQGVGVPGLEVQVLPQHGSDFIRGVGHIGQKETCGDWCVRSGA